jgi:radical SAM superfamily enzyme YgiQ (UPF0313 family)
MFREKRFRIRKLEDVLQDIDEARRTYPHVESIFLIDGNVLAVKTEFQLKILHKIKETFPKCKHIALYGSLNDFERKSIEDLKQLKQAGLSIVYAGLESGDPVVLQRIKKGMTPEEALAGMGKAKAAGIEVLLSIILGLGGKDRSREHIIETTRLLNRMQPEEIAPMALTVQPGTELEEEVESGKFVLPTPLQILEEEKYLLANLTFETIYWGDHGNNIVPLRGKLPESQALFLKKIEHALTSHPVVKEEKLKTLAW